MSSDPKDDVERLFACFKCGLSPPESALKERRSLQKKPKRACLAAGESSWVTESTAASCSKQRRDQDPEEIEKVSASRSTTIKLRNGKHISPLVFYGSPHGAPVKKPSQLLRLLREIRIDLREQNKLIPRDEVWATFPRQEEAARFAKTHVQTHIFSYQDHLSGQRRFLVSTYDEFWRRYKSMDPRQRHHYEVIQEVHDHSTNATQNIPLRCGNDFPRSYFSGRSPFPALDVFVESIASTGNVSGKIQSWYWFSAYGLMIYNLSRNRYCERIGREHKSNHVMYIVDFQRAGYYQKCHDPDCKGYRSPLRPVPCDVIQDCSALYNSTITETHMEGLNGSSDLQPTEINVENHSCEENWITDSCKKDSSWWQEAIRYADCIESWRNAPRFSDLEYDMEEDCGWWMDAEKVASQVEEQVS